MSEIAKQQHLDQVHESEFRARIRYRKQRLYERQWAKYVIWHHDHLVILAALRQMSGPVMYRRGGDYVIVMLHDDKDRVLFRMLIDFDEGDDRGFGIWGGKRYHSAETNRITEPS